MTRLEARRVARARERQRLRRAAVTALLVAPLVLVVVALASSTAPERSSGGDAALGMAPTTAGWPMDGSGTWEYAGGSGGVSGHQGQLRRYRVAVEDDLAVAPEAFAEQVAAILGAERGWSAGGEHRFRQVTGDAAFDFTIFLATPGTSAQMCAVGGFHTGDEASCRVRSQVIVNVARWLAGAPGYAAPLSDYRAYALNHLVGRELGYGPEACPGPGRAAPVMLPQAMGLQGCEPNAWPYRGVTRYGGPAIP